MTMTFAHLNLVCTFLRVLQSTLFTVTNITQRQIKTAPGKHIQYRKVTEHMLHEGRPVMLWIKNGNTLLFLKELLVPPLMFLLSLLFIIIYRYCLLFIYDKTLATYMAVFLLLFEFFVLRFRRASWSVFLPLRWGDRISLWKKRTNFIIEYGVICGVYEMHNLEHTGTFL